eukprot:g76939.t1
MANSLSRDLARSLVHVLTAGYYSADTAEEWREDVQAKNANYGLTQCQVFLLSSVPGRICFVDSCEKAAQQRRHKKTKDVEKTKSATQYSVAVSTSGGVGRGDLGTRDLQGRK